jgi:hypothetical protein
MPRGGVLSNFAFQGLSGATTGFTVVLRVNGANTAITCVTGATNGCSDTHTVTINAGDLITITNNGASGRGGHWVALLQ